LRFALKEAICVAKGGDVLMFSMPIVEVSELL
jgi:hypothetical protein